MSTNEGQRLRLALSIVLPRLVSLVASQRFTMLEVTADSND